MGIRSMSCGWVLAAIDSIVLAGGAARLREAQGGARRLVTKLGMRSPSSLAFPGKKDGHQRIVEAAGPSAAVFLTAVGSGDEWRCVAGCARECVGRGGRTRTIALAMSLGRAVGVVAIFWTDRVPRNGPYRSAGAKLEGKCAAVAREFWTANVHGEECAGNRVASSG